MRSLPIILLACLFSLPGIGQQIVTKADSLISAARYDDAQRVIAAAINASKDRTTTALLVNKLAEVYMKQGKLKEADDQLKTVVTGGDAFLDAVTKSNTGFLNLTRARNDLALENLQQALSLFQQSGKQSTREGARCLANLSLVYANTGKFNQARENGLLALQIRQQIFAANSEEVAASYNDLGLVFENDDPDKALDYYEKALAVYEKLLGPDHPKIAQAKSNIGFVYNKMKLYGDAITNFETAESILKKNYPEGHPSEAFAEVNLGLSYLQLKDKKTALGYLDKALALYRNSYGTKHSDIASVYNQMGLIRLSENQYEAALHDFQSALCANIPGYDNTAISSLPKLGQYYNGKVLLYSLRLKAQGLEALYYGKTLKFDNLKLALAALHACDTLIDDIRHHSTDENDKIELGESANETYEDGVRISVAMSEMSVDYRAYRASAFYFAEKSKSAVLQESIADAEAKSFAGIPQELVEEEKNLKAALTLLGQKLSQKPSPSEEKYLRESLFGLNRDYDKFIKKLEKDYPNYYDLKFNSRLPGVADLQKLLDAQTGIVSYFLAEKSKKIYQFTITSGKFKVRSLTLPDDFDKYIKGFTNSILYSEINAYQKSTGVLSPLLVPHFPAAIKNLVIIPSGRLGTLPFEALPYKRFKSRDFKTVPFLVKRFAVSYEFSAGLMAQKAKPAVRTDAPSIFLCAPVSFSDTTNLNGLPGTEKEVNTIAGLFGPTAAVATLRNASEYRVKSGKLSQYQYLHFATHGVVDEVNPALSRIYLNDGSGEDGNLFAGEIYSLDLRADLAVLSACQTGLGKVSKGEGVIGLSRALVYAGARNIIVSLWSVADESTSRLMSDFYKVMLANRQQNFRETLRSAKMTMINGGEFAAPFYWAPFVLIGF